MKTARRILSARFLGATAALLATTSAFAGPAAPTLDPKPASPATVAAQRAVAAKLPAEDGRDADFAARGFIATRADPVIRNAAGKPVWNLGAYDFMTGPAPDSVNPSLWRHIGLLRKHGLFKVSEGVWQVRGFDVSNMTIIRGQTGWIIVDPLTTKETAAAALELVNQQLGTRPVTAVIYSHSHGDHYGGVRGVVNEADVIAGKVAIIAPANFMEETVSENVMAGAAMGRRVTYQFGAGLKPGPQGQMGSGIGPALAAGEITLITPTDTIQKTGDTRMVDGVPLEFQIVSGSEAPSELNVYIVPARSFLSSEMSTCSFHNILTPRGAKVRDTRAWAGFLDEAARTWAPKSDTLISSHCWPRFGTGEVTGSLAAQRDNYRYLHDQSVRLMNQGATQAEIAEALVQPPALARDWFNHGYYGTYSHNSKAVYQFYLGWYDGNPANLQPHPPVERAKRIIAAMGGASKVLAAARKAMAAGDYRWSSDLLNQLVFSDPANKQARALLADSLEQQGYQAESAIWRNQFLMAAKELREGYKGGAVSGQGADMIAAVPTRELLDTASTRFDPVKAGGRKLGINLVLTDRKEQASVELTETTMIGRMAPLPSAQATLTGPRRLLLGLLFMKLPLEQLEMAGLKVEGDRVAVETWLNALDPVPTGFTIVEP
ncbi:alkyl sulfatase dimerization domain-containing protein [Novosphingobium sp.]|uniref:alkyl/aryl-sulfatase n=1 Tax=Novosphingobium sp. TaxID=1874826 RepID=UPI001EBD21E7|nr:alkyl sulfatase dimerization domain-containing protein [Novosphingobium sp.]MBK6801002.1 MBL fold metallo-hydrolase [Novosphingobium sp.]MBK9011560.1 MBL fold metallo-hydrolase [Novosphingobium sp.]